MERATPTLLIVGATQAPEAPKTEYERTTASRSRILFPIIAVVLLGAIGLSVVDMVGQGNHEVAVVAGSVAHATITARDFGFVPALIRVKSGVPLQVKIQNQGAHTHTFTIPELGVDVEIHPRTSTVVTLHIPAGVDQLLFFCRFHQALGMRGKIVVEK
jgi:plastocyanin